VLSPRQRLATRLTGTAPIWRRIAWTIGGVAVYGLGSQVALPGVNMSEVEHVGARYLDPSDFSIFGLGLTPVVTAFLLVEIVAALAWRAWRHGGAARRGKLGWVIALASIALAVLQAYGTTGQLELSPDLVASTELWLRLLQLASLVAGVMLLIALAALISRRGVGNGYAVLLVVIWAMRVPWMSIIDAGARGAFAVAAFAVIAVVLAAVLRWQIGRERAAQVPLPAGGYVALTGGAGLLLILGAMQGIGMYPALFVREWSAEVQHWLALELPLAAIGAAVCAALFARPGAWRAVLARAGLAPVDTATCVRATAASVLALVTVATLSGIAAHAVSPARLLVGPLSLLAIATGLDLYDELRDRRAGLVPVWPLHAPLLADIVRARLTAANIPHHLQAARLRTLLGFFGPFVPITVLVPADRAADAEHQIGELFQ
jgi:hypothetical protein